ANGLSLGDLERAAAAAGIDPEHVAAAIRDAERTEPEVEPQFADRLIGQTTHIREERSIPGRLDEALWQKIVLELRRTFDTTGDLGTLGALREWRSDTHVQKNLAEFQAEEVEGEVHLTLRRSWATQAGGSVAWLVLGGVLAPFFLLLGTQKMPMSGAVIGATLSVMASVLAFGLTRSWYRHFLSKEEVRSRQLMDRLEGIVANQEQARELEAARAALQAQAETGTEARLDLDALEERTEATAAGSQRNRTRTG
ncbi:MAG: hypothetical protein AAF809_05590, partial [Bacteroidota bacterium]